MFLELIGIVFAGALAGLVVYALNRLLGGRLAKWVMPVAAGCAMIAATISLEYGWFERTERALADGLTVASTASDAALFRPWTFFYPMTSSFVAVDVDSVLRNQEQPDFAIAQTYLYRRWAALQVVPALVDCAQGRLSPLANVQAFLADGSMDNMTWAALGTDDPVVSTICTGGT
ncbi:hypothetical protein [Aestuariibius sp. HNIBRBA575]|uniref:hypothetical protein n=1 Tax=Aestuariibius sp. HNIBRBA575 TaxID=3233343 RepID=UPI0034A45D15